MVLAGRAKRKSCYPPRFAMWEHESVDTVSMTGPGGMIAGRWVVEGVAGAGGTGVVYQARDDQGGDRVAVKVVQLADRGTRARFEREAEALQALSHPGIVRYVAHGIADDGAGYLVMEWLEG